MGNYQLTNKADTELDKIYEYSILNFGVQQADKYFDTMQQVFHHLADNPLLGRSCDHLKEGYRRHEHKHHIIFYKPTKTGVLILHILGASQASAKHLREGN